MSVGTVWHPPRRRATAAEWLATEDYQALEACKGLSEPQSRCTALTEEDSAKRKGKPEAGSDRERQEASVGV